MYSTDMEDIIKNGTCGMHTPADVGVAESVDGDLAVLFGGYKPDMECEDMFMAKLERRLAAVEYVKQMQEAQLRRYKWAALVAFVIGIVMGGGLIAVVLSMPADAFRLSLDIPAGGMMLVPGHLRLLLLTVLSLGMGYSVIAAVMAYNDLGVVAKRKRN